MNGPSPDQQRKMAEARESVARYWRTDPKTKELRRIPLTGFPWFLNLLWKQRHTAWEFYWWLAYRRAEDDMVCLANPIQSDNMPIKGFPMKYELQGGWTIPKEDLKYLTGGPLASEGLQHILVPASIGWSRITGFFRQFAPILGTAAALISIATNWATVLSFFALTASTF